MSTLTEIMVTQKDVLDELREIEQEIIDNDGEVTDELDARHDAALDKLLTIEGSVEEKIDGYGAVMTELEQEIESVKGREKPIKEMKKNLRSRRKALQRNRDKMKERLMVYLQEIGKERVEGDNFRFRRQSNGGRRSVDVDKTATPENVPEKYTRKSLDKSAIREDLKRLEELREKYDQARNRYDEAVDDLNAAEDGSEEEAEAEKRAKEHADYAEGVIGNIRELEETVGQFASLGERGEHIRKF